MIEHATQKIEDSSILIITFIIKNIITIYILKHTTIFENTYIFRADS